MSNNISEETTKGLVADKLKDIEGYPTAQNITVDGITWFKEDSYKGTNYDWLSDIFSKASKKQTLKGKGTPDFIIVKEESSTIIVIECKGDEKYHSRHIDVEDYKIYGYGTLDDTKNYAINGALWYATFLNDKYDVVAIGVSGQMKQTCKVTSFVLPRGGDISDIELIEDDFLENSMITISQYEKILILYWTVLLKLKLR